MRVTFCMLMALLMTGCMNYTYHTVRVEVINAVTGEPVPDAHLRVTLARSESITWPEEAAAVTDANGQAAIRMFTSSAGKLDLRVGDEQFIVRNSQVLRGGSPEAVHPSNLRVRVIPDP